MSRLVEIISGPNGELSSKRVTMLLAALSMSIAEVCLAIAAIYGRNVDVAITGVSAALAGLGGYSYVGGTKHEAAR